ncbi:MAG TPA: pseudouridine synthase, partial [Nakamurella sp.]
MSDPGGPSEDGVRLQKVLASAGVASRRKAEELIREGRVKVDGIVVREMGTRIDPANAVVHVDGNRITTRSDLVYLALNKERGVLSTMSDDLGRPHIGQMLEDRSERLFHVGRLDMESEGLLLLTNDGDLAHRLTHPSFGVAKTYVAEVPGPIPKDLGRRLRAGIELE